jgi:ketosteroid isomerase-like protein
MDEEIAALLRQGMEAFNQGDLERVSSFIADDVEVHASGEVGEPGTYHGREQFVHWNNVWMEAWETFHVDVEEIEQVDEENFLVHVHQSGRGRGSGLEVSQRVTYLFTVRDLLTRRLHIYPDRESALAAARS